MLFIFNVGWGLPQAHRIPEGNGRQTLNSVHSNEPLKLLLKDTIATLTVSSENSIQARLGGVGLPTAIKQADETITNLGNLVAVEQYLTHAIFVNHSSVGRLPISASRDSGIHLGFDLTHGLGLVDLLSMAPLGVVWLKWWTVRQLAQASTLPADRHRRDPQSHSQFVLECRFDTHG